jgi:hypothetical protein
MGYMKMFENFDRYEFGEYPPLDYFDIQKDFKQFPQREINSISVLLVRNGIKFEEDITSGISHLTMYIDENLYGDVYNLGDYCYVIHVYERMQTYDRSHLRLFVIDGEDSIIETYNKLVPN